MSNPCLYNLLIYGETKREVKEANLISKSLLERFPGKVVSFQREGEQFEVSEMNSISLLGGKANTYRGTSIRAGKISEENLHLLPLPYLVPDFPVILFWLPSKKETPLFRHLLTLSSRLIVDGGQADNLKDHFRDLNLFSSYNKPFIDLSWTKVEGWRQIFNELFFDLKKHQILKEETSIEITYNGSYTLLEALYLQAWIANKCGWTFDSSSKDGKSLILNYLKNTSLSTSFKLTPLHLQKTEEEGLLKVEISNRKGEVFQMVRQNSSLELKTYVTHERTCDLPFSLYLPDLTRRTLYFSSWIWGETSSEMIDTLPLLKDLPL